MKRQSKAEEALQKQIRRLQVDIDVLFTERGKIDVQINTTQGIITSLQSEIDRLYAARINASKRVHGVPTNE